MDTAETPASTIVVYGADWCGDCRRTKAHLDAVRVPWRYVDLVADPQAADRARQISGRTNIPVVVYPDGSHQVEPSDAQVTASLQRLGLLED